jgi:uncharacterized membrane protein required for colicin V production
MMLTIFVVAIMAIIVSMTLTEGFWGNLLMWINAILAAIIATNLYEPAADFMESQAPSLTYFYDFLSLWLIFGFMYGFLRAFTDQISKTRVRFKMPVETSGRILFGLLTGWLVVCFFMFSLHTAPLVRNHFGKAFGKAPDASNFFLDPDRLWLGFMQSRSEGAFATSEPNVFDPKSEFILKYAERRQRFSQLPGMTVDTRGRARR